MLSGYQELGKAHTIMILLIWTKNQSSGLMLEGSLKKEAIMLYHL